MPLALDLGRAAVHGVEAMSAGVADNDGEDLLPPFFTPFVSSVMRVRPDWIGRNGHMDIAHFAEMFDRSLDELFSLCGLGPRYVSDRNQSCFVVESRASYRQELTEGDFVRATVLLVNVDDKRAHCYLEIRHALDGWVAATAEKLILHVDLTLRRATLFPPDIRRQLEALRDAHAAMPKPERLGQGIQFPQAKALH
jgi:acyl-CoA thioester hydrolase